jgi:putative thioredoxin
LQGATQIYATILQRREPENIDAIAGLAEVLFELATPKPPARFSPACRKDRPDAPQLAGMQGTVRARRAGPSLGDAAALERALAENPKDHQARFDLALIQNAHGRASAGGRQPARDHAADREWNDDGARLQLLKFFEAWGMTDEATLAARRKLSSLLFS